MLFRSLNQQSTQFDQALSEQQKQDASQMVENLMNAIAAEKSDPKALQQLLERFPELKQYAPALEGLEISGDNTLVAKPGSNTPSDNGQVDKALMSTLSGLNAGQGSSNSALDQWVNNQLAKQNQGQMPPRRQDQTIDDWYYNSLTDQQRNLVNQYYQEHKKP